jgi:hypothetical protein
MQILVKIICYEAVTLGIRTPGFQLEARCGISAPCAPPIEMDVNLDVISDKASFRRKESYEIRTRKIRSQVENSTTRPNRIYKN